MASLSLSCSAGNKPPKAVEGVLDLSQWNFEDAGSVDLSGQWAFYWQQLLTPDVLAGATYPPADTFLVLPTMWNAHTHGGVPVGPDGFATFRLEVLLPPASAPLSLRFYTMGTAYAIYADGRLIGGAGTVGTTADDSRPDWRPQDFGLGDMDRRVVLVLHMSNFHHRKGGPVEIIELGLSKQVHQEREAAFSWQMFLAGAILIIGLYHLGLVAVRRSDLAPAYFAIFCILLSLYTLLSGERYFGTIFPNLSWQARVRLTNLTSFLSLPVFLAFLDTLFPKRMPFIPMRVVQWGIGGLAVLILLSPARIYSHTIPVFHLFILVGAIASMVALTRAIRQRMEGARIVLGGFGVLLLAVINDLLYDNMIVQTGQYTDVGLFLFVFCQAVLLSVRYSHTFQTIKEQRLKLVNVNAGYRREIEERGRIQTELETSEMRYRSLVDNTNDIIYTVDKSGVITTINAYGAEVLGLQEHRAVASRFLDFTHPEDNKWVEQEYASAVDVGGQLKRLLTFRILTHEDALMWVTLNSRIIYDEQGNVVREHGVARDITQSRLVSQQRSKLVKAKAENQAKSKFLARMSHEIRTPMNAILGYVQLLQRESGLTSRQRTYLETIDRSGGHLLTLLNDVLDMAKIKAGHVSLTATDVDVSSLLLNIERMFQFQALEKELVLTVTRTGDSPLTLRTDAGKVRQVLINLLSNALKFTNEGHIAVRVSSQSCAAPGVRVVMEVEDTGIGLDSGNLELIFGSFTQTAFGAKKAGTGLGLAISRQFARQLGGDLTATSEIGIGSIFRFEFLAERIDNADILLPTKRVVSLVPGTEAPRVLVVDDLPENLTVLARLLSIVGFAVRGASSGEEALAAFRAERPAIVLLDQRMPGMDGLEVMRRLRTLPGGDVIPVVMVSASTLYEDQARMLNAGAAGFLSKPLLENELFAMIRQHTGVDYVHAEGGPNVVNGAVRLDAASVLQLPEELLVGLRKAVRGGNLNAIEENIDQIERHNPQIGKGLRKLAGEFDYDTLLGFLGDGG